MIELFIWCAVGYCIVIREMRYDMDLTIGWLLGAIVLCFGGPFWLLKTFHRKGFFDKVLVKKFK